jgi:hypothetical protein
MVQAVILLTYIWEVPSSNLGHDTDYPDRLFVMFFCLKADAGIVSQHGQDYFSTVK